MGNPGSGVFIAGTGNQKKHSCSPPDPVSLSAQDHGLVWQCFGRSRPVCGRTWRYDDNKIRWQRLRAWHFDWWRYDFFG